MDERKTTMKTEHALKLNLCRRHLEPWQWGLAFKRLLETKGCEEVLDDRRRTRMGKR